MDISKLIKLVDENIAFCLNSDLPKPFVSEANLFAMAHNHFKRAGETLQLYQDCWARETPGTSAQTTNEKYERCINAGKTLFIQTVSSVEYCMKENIRASGFSPLLEQLDRVEKINDSFIQLFPTSLNCCKDRISKMSKILAKLPPLDSIGRIVDKSKSEDLITAIQKDELQFILKIRNCTVHNNGIADKDMNIDIRSNSVQLIKGKMIEVDSLGFFIHLTEVLTGNYANWLLNLHAKASGT